MTNRVQYEEIRKGEKIEKKDKGKKYKRKKTYTK